MDMNTNHERQTIEEYVTTLTERSQITLPAEVRRVLRIPPRGKVAFVIEGDQVHVRPARFTLAETFGSVPPRTASTTGTWEDVERIAHEDQAVRVVEE